MLIWWMIILLASSAQQAMNGSFVGGCTCTTSLEHFEMDSIRMDPRTTLVIDYLPATMTIHYLCNFFSSFGSVVGGYMESNIFPAGHRICGYLQMATPQAALGAVKATNGRDFDGFHVISSVIVKPSPESISVPKDSTVVKKSAGYLIYVSGYPERWKAQDVGKLFRQSCSVLSVAMMDGYCKVYVADETSLHTLCKMCAGGSFVDPHTNEMITLVAQPEVTLSVDSPVTGTPYMEASSYVQVEDSQRSHESVPAKTTIKMPGMGKKIHESMENSRSSNRAPTRVDNKNEPNKNGNKRRRNKKWTKKENLIPSQQPSNEHRPLSEHKPSNERRPSNDHQRLNEHKPSNEHRTSYERRLSNDRKPSNEPSKKSMSNKTHQQSQLPSQQPYQSYTQQQQSYPQQAYVQQPQPYQQQAYSQQSYQQSTFPQPYQQPQPSAIYQSLSSYVSFPSQTFQPSPIQSSPNSTSINASDSGLLVERFNHQYNEYTVKRLFRGFGRVIRVVFLDPFTA